MLKHGDSTVFPVSYVRYSGLATIQYNEGPHKGTQKVVPWTELTHTAGGEAEVAKTLRNVRIDA